MTNSTSCWQHWRQHFTWKSANSPNFVIKLQCERMQTATNLPNLQWRERSEIWRNQSISLLYKCERRTDRPRNGFLAPPRTTEHVSVAIDQSPEERKQSRGFLSIVDRRVCCRRCSLQNKCSLLPTDVAHCKRFCMSMNCWQMNCGKRL